MRDILADLLEVAEEVPVKQKRNERTWAFLGELLDKRAYRAAIAAYLRGQSRSISIGRSYNTARFSNSTPIDVVEGDSPPELVGKPYLMTTFRRGNFSKTLYTPSTLRVVVGRDWNAQ
jgi:hypothetical protein